MLLQQTPNPALRKTLLSASADFLAALEKRGHVDATTSLLKSTAHASWIDSRIARSHGGQTLSVPTRLPSTWVDGLCSRHSFDALRLHLEQPHYFLAELNALWLVFLENLYACQPSAAMEQTKATAQSHFKSLFFTPGLAPAGLVDELGNRSETEVASVLQAAALLPSLFSDAEVEALYQFAQPHFLDRQGKLMGVLVMVADGIPYYDDAQYHRGVSWPKTNPYLYRLLVRLRKTPQAHGLLESMLDHQQSEGAVFFSHELFSAENGGTPVKNPAQLFSQYVQPYYDALESV